jgi:hypothetical protein
MERGEKEWESGRERGGRAKLRVRMKAGEI